MKSGTSHKFTVINPLLNGWVLQLNFSGPSETLEVTVSGTHHKKPQQKMPLLWIGNLHLHRGKVHVGSCHVLLAVVEWLNYSRRSAAGSARTKVTRCHKRKCRCRSWLINLWQIHRNFCAFRRTSAGIYDVFATSSTKLVQNTAIFSVF